ncbi:phage tail sheath subtilisin-like domain-containing protein [Cronobacter dublinensis]|uniref:phage tail sheath subtilisin-like domain-containing protein n=1 Tax=Cronobacter TaxID=413496 RepID=UPI000CFD817E|nr:MULTISPECIES: phage tail sheath subtilisin-like domain-containing protein [Cronobacter]ELY2745828.1 phage tail sheath subtilisin-like domain-containing protein [Cronobacter sakazakii]
MSVSFDSIPSNIRVPLFYAEMDNSKANTAQTSAPALLIGQALEDAKIERNKLVLMPTADQARKLCGQGSPLARMVEAYRKTDPFGELYVIAVSDPEGAPAVGEVTFSGSANASGAVSLYIGARRIAGAVTSGDTALDAAQSLADAINAVPDLPVLASATVITNEVKVTSMTVTPKLTIKTGESAAIDVTILPENATNKRIYWQSYNPSVAIVDDDGNVSGISEGMSDVIATTDDGTGISSQCEVTVSDAAVTAASTAKRTAIKTSVAPEQVIGAKVTLTAKYSGEAGNQIPLMLNYYGAISGEEIPDGLTVSLSAMQDGAGVVSLDSVIAAMGDEPFDFIGLPYNDAATLRQMGEEMNDSSGRWSWSRQLYGHVYTAKIGTLTDLVAFGEALNDPHLTIAGYEPKTQTAPEELLASRLGRQAVFIRNDPARPTQTGEITGALPAPVGERFSMTERQSLLTHGIASSTVNSGTLLIERDITTYQKNKFGVADNSYLDSETLHTSAYVLRKLKSVITTKYPRHKLANDGTRFGPGQAIVTPSVLRGEMCAAYREMELAGIVENFDVFKKYLIVERNADDPNRVDVLFPADYVNQLRVFALKNQFRLQYSNEEMANG